MSCSRTLPETCGDPYAATKDGVAKKLVVLLRTAVCNAVMSDADAVAGGRNSRSIITEPARREVHTTTRFLVQIIGFCLLVLTITASAGRLA